MFFSFQGEAEQTGVPATWIRFMGCNLDCNGFGQKDPTDSTTYELPYLDFDVDSVSTVEELPVFKTGCDSSYSWSARYKHLAHSATAEEVVERLDALLKDRYSAGGEHGWKNPNTQQRAMMVFTGGEPMLNQKNMSSILNIIMDEYEDHCLPSYIVIETNATKLVKDLNFIDSILKIKSKGVKVIFSTSPKLFNVSGERDALKVEVLVNYAQFASTLSCKFVVNNKKDCWDELDEFLSTIKLNPSLNNFIRYWAMPVGATKEDQSTNEIADIADEAMKRGFMVSARVHAYVYGNEIGR